MDNYVDPVTAFVTEALKHEGENNTWTYKTYGGSSTDEWCAEFVCAVASVTGILNKVIVKNAGAGNIPRYSVPKNMGTYFKGPFFGIRITPRIGDLIFFRWDTNKKVYAGKDMYFASHVGIVVNVDDTHVHTVEGNSGNGNSASTRRVCKKTYKLNYDCISGYYRPDWSLVGGVVGDVSGIQIGNVYHPLYESQSTDEDATMREICYITKEGEPSINSTGIRLNVVNYTGALAGLFRLANGGLLNGAGSSVPDDTSELYVGNVDVSGLKPANAKNIASYLLNKNLSIAQAIGILANIKRESGFRTDAVNSSSKASGICQWYKTRRTTMIQHVGSDWKNNLSGQLDFLWYELNDYHAAVLLHIKEQATTNDIFGAYKSAEIFLREFEKPGGIESELKIRKQYVDELWKCLIFVKQPTSGTSASKVTSIL